jgi:coatomer protein complex subunit gamma
MSKRVGNEGHLSHLLLTSILESVFSLAALESKLIAYVADPAAAAQPFDISAIPKISRTQAAQEASRKFAC